MKQGTLINRIVMLLLLAAVLVYLGVSAWRSFRDPYTLVLSYAYTVDDSLEATGFLVREERVLASPGGIVDLLPEEGEKVSRGETVALLYQNDSGLARKEELQSLTMEKEQLQYALERTQSGGDSSQLSQQVIDAIVALRSSVSTGDLTRLEDETLLLKSLVYKRDFTFNGGEDDGDAAAAIQSSIDAVDAQIAALSAQAAQDTAEQALEALVPVAYNVYGLTLQHYYEGKSTSWKRALVFDGFLDESGIDTLTGADWDGPNHSLLLDAVGQEQVSPGFGKIGRAHV